MKKQYPLVVAVTATMIMQSASVQAATFATTANTDAGRLASTMNTEQVSAEATTAEAIAAASLPSSSILYPTTNAYQNKDWSKKSNMFGEQLFNGSFATGAGTSFNSGYVIQSGDNIQIRMWGAYQYAATMTVDPQGNIFLPNVGAVKLAGVTNGSLQSRIESAVRSVYRSNVGVYANLQEAQPIKVYVTGFVNQPGYYGGLGSDSVLSYLDRAGGVNPETGSYIDIHIKRGQSAVPVNLYHFLLSGDLPQWSFQDGDTIIVTPKKNTFTVTGAVRNDNTFEFGAQSLNVASALAMAQEDANATHFSVTRSATSTDREQKTEYYPLSKKAEISIHDGDVVTVTSDRYVGTIAVQVKGAHTGDGVLVESNGTRLKDIIPKLHPTQLANLENLTIYRESVAQQQKEMINESLDRLEEMTLATQSVTREEAELRQDDANLIKQFIAKARQVEPDGRIVVVEDSWGDIILQQGDIIEIPEKTSVITVNGQVRSQGALSFNPDYTVGDYIAKSGGFGDNADDEEILVVHQNGENQVVNTAYRIQQGDEIMVLPEVKTKKVEIARGISQVLYQLAVATGVIIGL